MMVAGAESVRASIQAIFPRENNNIPAIMFIGCYSGFPQRQIPNSSLRMRTECGIIDASGQVERELP